MSQTAFLNLEDLKTIDFAEKAEVEATQQEKCLTVGKIIEKLEALENGEKLKSLLQVLGTETIICRLFWYNEQVFCAIPKIYRNEENKIAFYDAQNDPQPIKSEGQIKFVSYGTEFTLQTQKNLITGHQIIAITTPEQTVAFKVPFGVHSDFQEYINGQYNPENPDAINSIMPNGKGVIPPEAVNYYPRSVRPMSFLQKGETFRVLENLGLDPRQPGATRFRLQQLDDDNNPQGSPFEVWANYSLRQHFSQYGNIPCTVISSQKTEKGTKVKFARADLAKVS